MSLLLKDNISSVQGAFSHEKAVWVCQGGPKHPLDLAAHILGRGQSDRGLQAHDQET